jgi:peptidyl-prolyl cis-trans isomerase A (cyclophilin A)
MEGSQRGRPIARDAFALVAAAALAVILIACGGGDGSKATMASAPGCRRVAAAKPKHVSYRAPRQTVRRGEKLTAVVKTSCGSFDIALDTKRAPKIANSFAFLARKGFYDGLSFHRIVPGFVIQGGGLKADFATKKTRAPISNEAKNGLKNTRGSLSMARTSDINSATSQFFVNLADNAFLDHGPRDYGYAVFGRVSEGMDVIDRIARVGTGTRKGYEDAPIEDVVIVSARRVPPA